MNAIRDDALVQKWQPSRLLLEAQAEPQARDSA
jgi:hypothetical protein